MGKKRRRENELRDKSRERISLHQSRKQGVQFSFTERLKKSLPWFLITFAVIIAYANTLGNDFVHDDRLEILDNRYIQKWDQLQKVFVTPAWAFMSQTGRKMESNYYRPVQYLTYAILYRTFGPAAWAFHLFKLLLHLAVCLLFFLLIRQTASDEHLALAATLIFSVHPINTEAVTWISGITDVLCSFFMLIGWLIFRKSQQNPSFFILIFFYLTFFAGILSKETTVIFIPLLFCTEWIQTAQFPSWKSWKRYYFPLLGLFVIYLAIRVHAIGGMTTSKQHQFTFLNFFQTSLNQIVLLASYLAKYFWPLPLNAFHSFDPVIRWSDWRVFEAIVILSAALITGWWLKNKMNRSQINLAVWGGLWFIFSLAPVIWFFKRIGENVFAERYMYPASLGLSLLTAMGINALYRRKKTLASISLAMLLVLSASQIISYNRIWKNDFVFYEATSKISPRAQQVWTNLGGEYLARGQREKAINAFQTSISIQPTPLAFGNLALLYRLNGSFDKAIQCYQKAIQLESGNFIFYSGLADVYRAVNNPAGVVENLHLYLELAPNSPANWFNLADALLSLRKPADAITAYERALKLSPGDAARAYLGMTNAYRDLHQKEKTEQMMKLYFSSIK